jgi:hypothetical protein
MRNVTQQLTAEEFEPTQLKGYCNTLIIDYIITSREVL